MVNGHSWQIVSHDNGQTKLMVVVTRLTIGQLPTR
jgi:hypothetical protein